MHLTTKAQKRLRTGIKQLQNEGTTILPLNPDKPMSFQITSDADLLSSIYHGIIVDGQVYYLGIKK